MKYTDLTRVLDQRSRESVVSIFQHFRFIPFPRDFARIRERIGSVYSTVIYWHSLMFIAVSKSEKAIKRVISANKKYTKINPGEVIA